MIFDEFPTIYFNGIDNLITTARANKVAVTLTVQDYSQFIKGAMNVNRLKSF